MARPAGRASRRRRMSLAGSIDWRWRPRGEPLPAGAAVAWGATARALHQRLLKLEPA
ncbi:bpX5 domain-containing protein, partial [Variovorax sp.]|uniref:bpX5 domain-containing protein n=1 Tax=Variovorax sp. TaxID=1871043 RepID=UPI0040377EA1